MKSYERKDRVASLLKRELARLLLRESKDPRFTQVTITEVTVSSDLSFAKVYLTVVDEQQQSAILDALAHAEGHFRKQLHQKLRMRRVPVLQFMYDEVIARSAHVTALIDKALAEDQQHAKDADSSDNNDPS